MYLGLNMMFQKIPITVLSARPKQSAVFEVLLVAEVETVLVASELLVKKGTTPHESVTLEEEEEVLLSSDALLVT